MDIQNEELQRDTTEVESSLVENAICSFTARRRYRQCLQQREGNHDLLISQEEFSVVATQNHVAIYLGIHTITYRQLVLLGSSSRINQSPTAYPSRQTENQISNSFLCLYSTCIYYFLCSIVCPAASIIEHSQLLHMQQINDISRFPSVPTSPNGTLPLYTSIRTTNNGAQQ